LVERDPAQLQGLEEDRRNGRTAWLSGS